MNQSDERKDNIQRVIETALDMFMENGIAATSMNQIARKVNLSQMSLYRYFGNKPANKKSSPKLDLTEEKIAGSR